VLGLEYGSGDGVVGLKIEECGGGIGVVKEQASPGLEREVGIEVVGSQLGGDGHGGAGAPVRYVKGGEVSRDGAGAGGGDDSRLGLLEEPLYGLAVGLVSELPRELEDSGGAESGHSNSTAAAVDFGVAVFGGGSFGWWLFGGGFGGCGEEGGGSGGVGGGGFG